MLEDGRPQRQVQEFAEVIAGPEKPLIIGGQAVNLWAQVYSTRAPKLKAFKPFTSKDADIYGTRALAETLARRTGWDFTPSRERDSVVVGILSERVEAGRRARAVEVLREVNGLDAKDLAIDVTIERNARESYRLPPPTVLLKAKIYNLISLVATPRPQDAKHARMLALIVPQYLNELRVEARAGRSDPAVLIGALNYLARIMAAGYVRNAVRSHALDFSRLVPPSIRLARGEIGAAGARCQAVVQELAPADVAAAGEASARPAAPRRSPRLRP